MTTAAALKIVKRTDRNTRALAKVVSAMAYLRDEFAETAVASEAVKILEYSQSNIIQERRNLRVALWKEIDKQG